MNSYTLLAEALTDALETTDRPDVLARRCGVYPDVDRVEVVTLSYGPQVARFHYSDERTRRDAEIDLPIGIVIADAFDGYLP